MLNHRARWPWLRADRLPEVEKVRPLYEPFMGAACGGSREVHAHRESGRVVPPCGAQSRPGHWERLRGAKVLTTDSEVFESYIDRVEQCSVEASDHRATGMPRVFLPAVPARLALREE